MALPDGFDVDDFVRRVLAEDLGTDGDVTSKATIAEDAHFTADMNCRQRIVVAGIDLAAAFFRALDPNVQIEALATDGDLLVHGTTLMRLSGNARAMLAAERSALNTLQHLSGIATLTRHYVDAITGTGTVLLDTRKTLPGLRILEKYAARMGGAENHRMQLDDGVLIKDNHVAVCGSVEEAVRRAEARSLGDLHHPLGVRREHRVEHLRALRPPTPGSRSRSKSTGSSRSSRRSPPAPTGCCSTIWTRQGFGRR